MNFYMTGYGATNILRDLWTDDNPQHAITTAEDGFNLPLELAFDLFTGERKFVGDTRIGDGTLDLVCDDDEYKAPSPTEMLARIVGHYAEEAAYLVDVNTLYLRAKRSGWVRGDGDALEEAAHLSELIRSSTEKSIKIYTNILYLAQRLDLSVGSIAQLISDANTKRLGEVPMSDKEKRTQLESRFSSMVGELTCGEVTSVEEVIEQTAKDITVKTFAAGDTKSGYLAPDGSFYGCGFMQHLQLQDQLIEAGIWTDVAESVELVDLGWIKISVCRFTCPDYGKTSKRQIDFICDFFGAHDLEKAGWNGANLTLPEIMEDLSEC